MKRRTTLFAGAITLGFFFASFSTVAATALSKAQQDIVDTQIAKLQTSEERSIASEWSNAKKVAEFICRPLAMSELKKWSKDADRVFLSTDDPGTLSLTADKLLTGSGQVRTGNDWTEFTFKCELDPGTGKALSFKVGLSSQ
jgi:hypothetical protein